MSAPMTTGVWRANVIAFERYLYSPSASAFVGAVRGNHGGDDMAWLIDGRYDTIAMAISSMIGDVSGMICDGASNSCAMKVSTSASAAWKAVLMALDDTAVTGEGIVAHNVEQSLRICVRWRVAQCSRQTSRSSRLWPVKRINNNAPA